MQALRHDKALHTVKIQQHLADVPEYIVPTTLKAMAGITKRTKRKRENYRSSESSTSKFEVKCFSISLLKTVFILKNFFTKRIILFQDCYHSVFSRL